jgi:hypothetical protein
MLYFSYEWLQLKLISVSVLRNISPSKAFAVFRVSAVYLCWAVLLRFVCYFIYVTESERRVCNYECSVQMSGSEVILVSLCSLSLDIPLTKARDATETIGTAGVRQINRK